MNRISFEREFFDKLYEIGLEYIERCSYSNKVIREQEFKQFYNFCKQYFLNEDE
jgi:hypothetical protein